MAEFADSELDLVFSNSVLEHVGGPREREQMASEVRRTGRGYLVQTPNRGFPIERHFHVPFFQFMPTRLQAELIRRFDLGWRPREPELSKAIECARSVQLLTRSDLQRLFPDSEIHSERLLGLTKSLFAVKRAAP